MPTDKSKPSNAAKCMEAGLFGGLILGYPVSYYFQSGALRAKLSLGQYIAKASEIVGHEELRSAIVIGIVVAIAVCVGAGFFIGRSMDQKT